MSDLNLPNEDNRFDFLSFILDSIKELFAFKTDGRITYGPEEIAIATLLMCSLNTSAETIQMIESLPSADRILARLGEEKGLVLGEKVNQMLKKRVLSVHFPPGVQITAAFDLVEKAYYGSKDNPVAMGGKHKAGTNYFLKYLTVSLVVKGHRFPVGFYPLTQLHLPKLPKIIDLEIQWLKEHLKCERVLLDRGFNDKKIYNAIDREGVEFLMPFKRNEALNKAFNTALLFLTKRQKRKGFSLKGYKPKGWTGNYRVVACRIKVSKLKKGEEWKWVFFITNMLHRPSSLLFIYRQRWGIETAYRQVHTLGAFTNSRRYGFRVFLFGLAFLLFAAWVHINWSLATTSPAVRRKKYLGSPVVSLKRFKITMTLPQMRLLLTLSILTRLAEKTKIKFDA